MRLWLPRRLFVFRGGWAALSVLRRQQASKRVPMARLHAVNGHVAFSLSSCYGGISGYMLKKDRMLWIHSRIPGRSLVCCFCSMGFLLPRTLGRGKRGRKTATVPPRAMPACLPSDFFVVSRRCTCIHSRVHLRRTAVERMHSCGPYSWPECCQGQRLCDASTRRNPVCCRWGYICSVVTARFLAALFA